MEKLFQPCKTIQTYVSPEGHGSKGILSPRCGAAPAEAPAASAARRGGEEVLAKV